MRGKRKKTLEELARLGPDDEFAAALSAMKPESRKRALKRTSVDGRSMTISCVFSGSRMKIALANGADPIKKDNSGTGPIHWAASLGHHEAVSALLAAGADPNEPGGKNELRPLHYAAGRLSAKRVAALLAGGADPSLTDARGRTPADSALEAFERRKSEERVPEKLAEATAAFEALTLGLSAAGGASTRESPKRRI